jgi:hypothetical protein
MTDLQDSHNLLNQDLPGWDEGQQDAFPLVAILSDKRKS